MSKGINKKIKLIITTIWHMNPSLSVSLFNDAHARGHTAPSYPRQLTLTSRQKVIHESISRVKRLLKNIVTKCIITVTFIIILFFKCKLIRCIFVEILQIGYFFRSEIFIRKREARLVLFEPVEKISKCEMKPWRAFFTCHVSVVTVKNTNICKFGIFTFKNVLELKIIK